MTPRVHALLACLLVFVSAVLSFAQGGTGGTILGTVVDASGAVVANADVTITNTATNVARPTKTTESGDYTFPYLTPGVYKVSVEVKGFQTSVVDNITLAVAQQARVNLTLKTGAVTEVVEVQAGAVALDTDTSTVSQIVTQKQVDQLPLNGRNFLSLLFIGAGAVETNGEQGVMRQGAGNAISINGGRPTSNNYTLDGLVNTDTALNTPAVILSQDAIQEFKVQSETYSAEYGFSANQINIVSKSGSNQLHGTAFEFLRNDALDAHNPFDPAGSKIAELRQNQFGFVLGGPVYIPKLYDGRNKSFFLANYEGWRIVRGNTPFFGVPDPSWVKGNFSSLAGAGTPTTAGGTCVPGPTAFCRPVDPLTGAPFAGDIIPSPRFSRLAQVAIGANLIPAPNCIGCGPGNFRLNATLPQQVDQQTYRFDQSFSKFGSVFFRYTTSDYSNQGVNGSYSAPAGFSSFVQQPSSWAVSHTINLGTRNINSFRFGHLTAISNQGGTSATDAQVSALGLTGVFTNLPDAVREFPDWTFNGPGLTNNGRAGSQVNDATTSDIRTWEFADSLTMIRGKHTIGVGADYRTWLQKRNLAGDFLGQYNFINENITSNVGGCANPGGICGTGNSVADFLLGYYNTASTFQPGPFANGKDAGNTNRYQFMSIAPYVQDDWKVSNRLTLNLGLRWDFKTVPYERDNKMFWFDRANPGGGLCFADKNLQTKDVAALGGPIAPSGNGFYRYCGRRNPADGSKRPFAPRFGLAYRLTDKTVVRGGYGIFFDSAETREIDNSGDIYPNILRANVNPNQDPTAPKVTDNLFPPVPLHQVSVADGGQFFAVIISEFPRNPYVQQWSFSVQRELAKGTTLEANYVGNRGTHLLNRVNIGQPLPPPNPSACDPSTGGDPNSVANLCPISSRRPFANITSGVGFLDSQWNGTSNYNAGNLKLEHRSGDLALLAVYTWAKSLDEKSAAAGVGSAGGGFSGHMNEHDQKADYGPSDFDVNHRFVFSSVYQLPIGRGKKFLGGLNRVGDAFIGGWQLTSIATFQKGFPFSAGAANKNGLLLTFQERPNAVPGCDPNDAPRNRAEWFNPACFTQPLAGQFGNVGRNTLRGPGISNFDLGLGKDFKFTERVAFQLRLEAFNVFNHTQLGVDPTNGGGAVAPVSSNISTALPPVGNLGQVVSARPGRILQIGGKFVF